jgi:hypothetical protein
MAAASWRLTWPMKKLGNGFCRPDWLAFRGHPGDANAGSLVRFQVVIPGLEVPSYVCALITDGKLIAAAEEERFRGEGGNEAVHEAEELDTRAWPSRSGSEDRPADGGRR